MPSIAFLINGNISQWKKVAQNIEKVFSDIPHKVFITEYPAHLPKLTHQALQEGYKSLIVAGGDGSINELVNGCMSFLEQKDSSLHTSDLRLGIIPMGTGNDFCKTLKIASTLEQLKDQILKNSFKSIDIGEAHFFGKNQQAIKRYYINITDVGMGGEVVEKLAKNDSFFSKSAQYQIQILKTFFSYKKSYVLVKNGEKTLYQGKAMNVVVANGKYFGNGLGIAPEASLQDGQMEIIVLGDITTTDYLLHLSKVKKCEVLSHPHVFYHRVKEVEITSTDNRKLAIDMDGEFVGYAPLKIINLSQQLYFYC